jgi:hypothetical protein
MYFGEREAGAPPRGVEELTADAWRGIIGEIVGRTEDGFLAEDFPKRECPDKERDGNDFITGCKLGLFYDRLKGDNPSIRVPLNADNPPETVPGLELIEWVFRHVSRPFNQDLHDHFGDCHYKYFNRHVGQAEFGEKINTIFRRHHLAFELQGTGEIRRIGAPVLREALQSAVFRTEDAELNRLLERARQGFSEPDFHTRYDALKDLFDAFERMKTLEPPHTKPAAAEALIARVSPEPKVREMLSSEMRKELQDFGNGFFIRHADAGQVSLQTSEEIDYLFHRLFALIRLLLKTTGQGE